MLVPVLLDYWYEGVQVAVMVESRKLYDRVADKITEAYEAKRSLPLILDRRDMQMLQLGAISIIDLKELPPDILTVAQH